MRKSGIIMSCVLFAGLAAPALAVGLGDLAKVVLGGGSILSTGQQKCGTTGALTPLEQMQLTAARSAAQKAIPLAQFLSLDQSSNAAAATASQSPTFCNDTQKQKKGLLSKIAKAAKGLAGAKLGL
jgi:hypothetical protein